MSDITVTLNFAQPEKFNAPWSKYKSAKGMAFSHQENGVFFDTAIPEYAWQEPNTGIIIAKPTFLRSKRFDPAYVGQTWYIPLSLNYGGTEQGGGMFSYFASTGKDTSAQSEYVAGSPKLVTITDKRLGLTVDGKLQNFIDRSRYSDQNFVWSIQTQVQLQANQAWAMMITPSGIAPDFADSYWMVAFGQKLILEITMAGVHYLYGDVDGFGTYVLVDTYVCRDGGVNFKQAFQISVIPLGKRFISVSFTQATAPGLHSPAATYSSKPESFITRLAGQSPLSSGANNLEPTWDASLNQWVKYPAAPLTIGLVSDDFDYNFLIAKGYFPSSAIVFMAKEYPPAKPIWNGTIGIDTHPLFFDGQTEATGGSPAYGEVILYDQNGTPYTAASGNALVSAVTLWPSQNGVYSCELHAYGVSYPANVQTPDWTPIDVSADWQLIRFMLTTDLSPQRVEMKLIDDANYLTSLKMVGPCRIAGTDNSGNPFVFADFYNERKQSTMVGPSQLMLNQFEGLDMWDRLNTSPLLLKDLIEGSVVAETFKEAIEDAGFLDFEVFIDYAASPELYGITFGKFTNPNDLLRPNTDATIGDFIRNTCEKLGAQYSPPIRVRWVNDGSGGMHWRIYLGPIYGERTDFLHGKVQHRFFLDDSLVSKETYGTEQVRFQAHDFMWTSQFEWTDNRPEFNSLEGDAATYGSRAEAHRRRIPPPDRALNDPTYFGFEGAERNKQIGVEKLQIASTGNATECILRQYYEQNYNLKRLRHVEGEGEWQPEIDVDDFFVVIGRAKTDDPAMVPRYLEGDPVSYGAWRFEHIDIEIRHDFEVEDSVSTRWEWAGSLTATYVGPYEDVTFNVNGDVFPLVMWTTAANLPDNYDLPDGFTP